MAPVPGGAVSLTTSGLTFVHPNGDADVIVTPDPGRIVTNFEVDQTHDHDIVWVESIESAFDYVDPIIWTSPLAQAASGIHRRKVTHYSDALHRGGAGMTVNGGMFSTVVDKTHIFVARLSDGQGWSVDARPNSLGAPIHPIWIDSQDIWVLVSASGYLGEATGLLRLDRSALGPPFIPAAP